jgi:ribosome-binding protein aMBF1 (putative translation factor)
VAILKEYFYRCWEKNMSYDEYLREVIKQTGASIKTLASELQIDEEELERLSQV